MIRSVTELCGCAHCSLTQAKAARNQDVKPKATTKVRQPPQTTRFHPDHGVRGRGGVAPGVATKTSPQKQGGTICPPESRDETSPISTCSTSHTHDGVKPPNNRTTPRADPPATVHHIRPKPPIRSVLDTRNWLPKNRNQAQR